MQDKKTYSEQVMEKGKKKSDDERKAEKARLKQEIAKESKNALTLLEEIKREREEKEAARKAKEEKSKKETKKIIGKKKQELEEMRAKQLVEESKNAREAEQEKREVGELEIKEEKEQREAKDEEFNAQVDNLNEALETLKKRRPIIDKNKESDAKLLTKLAVGVLMEKARKDILVAQENLVNVYTAYSGLIIPREDRDYKSSVDDFKTASDNIVKVFEVIETAVPKETEKWKNALTDICERLRKNKDFREAVEMAYYSNILFQKNASIKALAKNIRESVSVWRGTVLDKIKFIEKTEDETDDKLLGIYDVLNYYASDIIDKLNILIEEDAQSNNLDSAAIDEVLTKNCEYLEEAKNKVDLMLTQYLELCEKFDNVQNNFSIYIPTTENSEADKCLFAVENFEDELFDLSRKLLDKRISVDDKAANNMKWAFGLIKAAGISMNNLYAKANEAYLECQKALKTSVDADVKAINDRFSRVEPTVPELSPASNIYVQDATGRFVEADVKILQNDGVATIALSTIFTPYFGMSYQDLTKLGANYKWCSIETFKKFELISQDAQAAFIVDDGYGDYGIDKAAFVYFKSSTHGLSLDDIGKIYFSESAFKKFRQITCR